MARVSTSLDIFASPDAVWALVTDWRAHGRWIPLTVVTIDADSPSSSGLGTKFTGRSGLGRLGFDDPMTVTEWQPPGATGIGRCALRKAGPWVLGSAVIEVSPNGAGTRLTWTEDIRARWTPGFADPLVSVVGNFLFSQTLRKVAAELT